MTVYEKECAAYWLEIIAKRDGFNVEQTLALIEDGEDDHDEREWAESCRAMNEAEGRWVDAGCPTNGYSGMPTDDDERIPF